MTATIIGIYTFYILVRLYVSVMQIGYINQIKRRGAVLMGEREYLDAANYAVAKEKLGMLETFVEFGLFLIWIGGLMRWLDEAFAVQSESVHAIAVVMGMVLINSLVQFPFGWIAKFKIDAQYGFNRSSVAQFVKDTLISTFLTIVIGSLMVWIVAMIITSSALWWLWTFVFIFAVVIAINMFFPTI
ncbi:MAG: M48 family peptidase, partial [Sulfuricurvum sp.]|nr:M48 family peptidase [Sulfuricurvum sp.]